jgi:hypothetical protein
LKKFAFFSLIIVDFRIINIARISKHNDGKGLLLDFQVKSEDLELDRSYCFMPALEEGFFSDVVIKSKSGREVSLCSQREYRLVFTGQGSPDSHR